MVGSFFIKIEEPNFALLTWYLHNNLKEKTSIDKSIPINNLSY